MIKTLLRKLGFAAAWLGGMALCIVVYGLTAGEFATFPPDNAKLILDTERHIYASIPCVIRGQTERDLIVDRSALANPDSPLTMPAFADEGTMGQVRAEGRRGIPWKQDPTCEANGGFNVRWRIWQSKPKARWTPDGDWRW